MTDRADLFLARVARLKSIPEGVLTWEIMDAYEALVTEARAIITLETIEGNDHGQTQRTHPSKPTEE